MENNNNMSLDSAIISSVFSRKNVITRLKSIVVDNNS